MSEKKRKVLKRLLSMTLALVMAVVSSGFVGKVDVQAAADSICKVTVEVKDKDTGAVIPDAKVIFTEYYRNSTTMTYPEVEVTQNEDGTYNVPYDSSYGTYYRYYAVADGYKDSRTEDARGILYGARLTVSGDEMTATAISLEPYPAAERLQTAITNAQNAIKDYLNQDDYDADQVAEINAIIDKYLAQIDEKVEVGDETNETVAAKTEILNGIVSEAKEELDKVTTSQENTNEAYIDCISFVPESGEAKSFARINNYGRFAITLSRYQKGSFVITGNDADTNVTWNAQKEMFSYSAGGKVPFDIIDNTYDKGVFLNSRSFPEDINLNEAIGTIENCSATFTKDGKEITVTFDLVIVGKLVEGLSVEAPADEIVLSRNDDLEYTTALKRGEDYSVKVDYNSGESVASDDIEIVSLNDVAAVDEDGTIRPLKAGEAEFKAVYTADDKTYEKEFTITFKMNATEEKEADAAAEVEEKIAALGTITLDSEDAVKAAKAAYDALSDGAKKKVSEESLNALTAAVDKISELKDKEIAELKAALEAAEKKAAAAEKAQKEAEAKAAAAEAKAAFRIGKPSVTAKAAAYNKVTVTWKKYTNATSYRVYRKTSTSGWKLLTETTSLSYTDTTAATGTTYYYTVKAVSTKWGGKTYSQYVTNVTAKTTLTTPAISSAVSSKTKQATVTWKKVSGASGYVVYRATSKNGTYKAVATIKSGSTVKYTNTGLTKGTTYYYKVKAYRTVSGKNVYSSASAAKSVKSK